MSETHDKSVDYDANAGHGVFWPDPNIGPFVAWVPEGETEPIPPFGMRLKADGSLDEWCDLGKM